VFLEAGNRYHGGSRVCWQDVKLIVEVRGKGREGEKNLKEVK